MKKPIFCLLLVILTHAAKAQKQFQFDDDDEVYAVIKDTDGFTNIRSLPNATSAIVGKIYNYQVFSCEANKTNWWKVLYIDRQEKEKGKWIEGYIYKTHVSLIENWIDLSPTYRKETASYKSVDLVVSIATEKFNSKQHKLSFSGADPTVLTKIDGKFFWGTDGEIPTIATASVKVFLNGASIPIPENAYDDLYEPRTDTISLAKLPDGVVYIKMFNSDGAGAYAVIWIFKDGKYYGRYIDNSEA